MTTHNEMVVEAATALGAANLGGKLYVDHVGRKVPGAQEGKPPSLPGASSDVAAIFVPTAGLCSRFLNLGPEALDWGIPDIVLEKDGFRYLVEVSHNESFIVRARKLENMLHGSKAYRVCGIALLAVPTEKRHIPELRRMRATFWKLFPPEPDPSTDPDAVVPYLRALLERINPVSMGDGQVGWSQVRELTAGLEAATWKTDLTAAVAEAFKAAQLVVR